jgi:YHS domain-containing protein
MLLIEVFVPRGVLGEQERQALGQRLVDTLMVEEDSHAIEVLDAQRTITQVLIHEPSTWVLGQRPAADPSNPPRYLVRVSVPASWRKETSGHFVRIVTDVLAETERAAGRDPERVRRDPHVTVLVEGVSEGGIGVRGMVMGSMDLMEFVSRPYRDNAGSDSTLRKQLQGTLVDPVCGMRADLADSPPTLVHEGTMYAFCHGLCRRAFADEHGIPLGR